MISFSGLLLTRGMLYPDHVYFVHPSTDISVEISTDTRPMYRSTYRPTLDRYVGRHIGRHSADMLTAVDVSTDISVERRSICRPIHWSSIGRYVLLQGAQLRLFPWAKNLFCLYLKGTLLSGILTTRVLLELLK